MEHFVQQNKKYEIVLCWLKSECSCHAINFGVVVVAILKVSPILILFKEEG